MEGDKEKMGRLNIIPAGILILVCLAAAGARGGPEDSATIKGDRTASMWEYTEWSVRGVGYSQNPFDAVANVTFTHSASSRKRTTEMFYDGDKAWKFRFTGTRPGRWTFVSQSDVDGLDGLAGSITVTANRNPKIKGFVRNVGNKFAVQARDDRDLKGYIFNVYMGRVEHPAYVDEFGSDPGEVERATQAYFANAMANGFEIIFIHVNNNWFKFGARKYSEHTSENPDPLTFSVLEKIITTVHNTGGRVHIWAWGDESRKWTPIGVPGGINGKADRRLQKYIAARLGPLPGWTMGYGFDLHEWVSTPQINNWAGYLHGHFGWQHLLCARGQRLEGPCNMNSYDGFGRGVSLATTSHGPVDYAEIVEDMDGNPAMPHFYEERHSYKRSGFKLDMDGTRRLLWWESMAGGMGGFFGFYPDSPHPYPNPEQLRTHHTFWHGRERFLLDMKRANNPTDSVLVLRDPSGAHCVFYKEDASWVRMDLSATAGAQPAVAVDTKKQYAEIEFAAPDTGEYVWTAPYRSDWAIATGRFPRRTTGAGGP